jgi:hypothetical protein
MYDCDTTKQVGNAYTEINITASNTSECRMRA